MKHIGKEIKKVDADLLLAAQPAYTGDLVPEGALIVKVLRSPHPHAIIEEINTAAAERMEGVACVLTWKNCPYHAYTNAGQGVPQQTPYDRHILDKKVRYVGDEVAIVAAETERIALQALKRIRVKYRLLPPVLDYETAEENPSVIHDQDDYIMRQEAVIHNDRFHNILSQGGKERGEWDKTWKECAYTVEGRYHTQAAAQSMMETFVTAAKMDTPGHLTIITSTQIPFHVRRITADALGISPSQVNVIKPKVGGGFGAKQTSVSEVYPAAVTWMTGKPCVYTYTRSETFSASNSRHAMRMDVKLGCDKDGNLLAAGVSTLSNAGAYGEHGTTTVRLSYQRPLIMCNHAKAIRMSDKVVYTNQMPGAAFRGFGNTQGVFAVECAINELAIKAGIDPLEFRLRNMIEPGEVLFTYYDQTLRSCTLKECLLRGAEMIGWDPDHVREDLGNGIIRAKGMAVCAQGTAMKKLVSGSVLIKLNEFGFYTLLQGAGEMGQGCETVFAQMAAEVLQCPVEKIHVKGVETDVSPFDSGSYSSSSTYTTGHASIRAAKDLREKILAAGAALLECDKADVEFDGRQVIRKQDGQAVSLDTIAGTKTGQVEELVGHGTFVPEDAPTPFMAGFAEIEVDTRTGRIIPIRTVGVVDCGVCINKALCRVQAEGGLAQGIGMALYENVLYDWRGKVITDSFLQYKIPARPDVGRLEVDFRESYEPTGPFGAKSIGEVVINTPAPAIAHALYNACGVWIRDLPMTPEKVLLAIRAKEQ